MAEPSQRALEELLNLAKEYDAKQRELDHAASEMDRSRLLRHFLALGERATDRFRAAQHVLFTHLYRDDPSAPDAEVLKAASNLCRSFDELLLLFHRLMDETARLE